MKKHLKITGIALALAMAMMLAVAAFAESPDTPAAETPAADAPVTEASTADTALQEALKALQEARSSDRFADLEAELKAYVEAGKMTQEQSDLILKAYKDQEALHNGVCPNCGYQFSSGGFGRGGQMKDRGNGMMNGFGGRGGRGGHGGFNVGGRFGQQGGTQPGSVPAAPEAAGN
ncbi:MAG: hypothetical protein IJK28_10645 [Clostridia bacterium]|nr:hypothetical protein [Clostridia bacterium]